MSCDFVSRLSILRKLSAESVENTSSFAPFKKYLHVERRVETELRDLLREINARQGKCLVLLCGSAGDGKSHLISYLKNADSEGLLADYEPYNDATESSEPTLTAIDTLATRLVAFNDDSYMIDDGKKMIIAINLGTLNNFIDSEQGAAFSKLKEYVETNDIFSGYSEGSGYKESSVFQHVSFSDYQVFALNENGIETSFLENLVSKIFDKTECNPFYKAYLENSNCPLCSRCPVRHNYEFLSKSDNQKVIVRRIIEAVIVNKAIVSTRDVLNLIYDLMVHPDFDKSKIIVGTSDVAFLTYYIGWTTPMLLNEYNDISALLNVIKLNDILQERDSEMDSGATRFHSMDNISEVFSTATTETPYQVLNGLTDVFNLGGIKPELKKLIYRFIVRLNDFANQTPSGKKHDRLTDYMKYLYYQNSGQERKLAKLYDAAEKAVHGWDGQFGDDYICIDDTNDFYWILEQLDLEPDIRRTTDKTNGAIYRFSPVLKIRFRKKDSESSRPIELSIDFSLYELISDMREGYRPTVQDKNRHADFVSFVQQLIQYGNKATRATIVPKDGKSGSKIVFEKNAFGYEFKVVG